MPFSPEAVHHRVHVFNLRIPVEFGSQQLIQFAKSCLIGRKIVTWHAIVFAVAHLRRVALPLSFELHIGNFVEEKIRHTGLGKIGILQHHAKADSFVVAAREIEDDLPPLGKFETARLLLNISPVWPHVDVLREGQLDQVFQRLFHGLSGHMQGTGIVGRVNSQAHAEVADDVFGWRRHHPHFAVGDHGGRPILRKWSLIQAIGNWRRPLPIVFVPIVLRNVGVGVGGIHANRESSCSGRF